jgi:hypothetical protein
MLHHQFEAMTDHNKWTPHDRPMHLLTILKREATYDLCSVPARAPYKDKVKVLLGHYRYHQTAVTYLSKPKARAHLTSELLQESATPIQQLVHWVLAGLPKYCIQEGEHLSKG